MVANPQTVERRARRVAHVDNENVEIALIKLLDEVVYYKDAEGLFVRATEVSVRHNGDRWIVEATLEGEPIDRQRHELTGDVKAVTVHRLEVRHTAAGWEATVILDV
jgi:SHS2 domain-containing protein